MGDISSIIVNHYWPKTPNEPVLVETVGSDVFASLLPSLTFLFCNKSSWHFHFVPNPIVKWIANNQWPPLGTHSWFLYLVFVFLLGAICTREVLREDFLIAEKVTVIPSSSCVRCHHETTWTLFIGGNWCWTFNISKEKTITLLL